VGQHGNVICRSLVMKVPFGLHYIWYHRKHICVACMWAVKYSKQITDTIKDKYMKWHESYCPSSNNINIYNIVCLCYKSQMATWYIHDLYFIFTRLTKYVLFAHGLQQY